MSSRTSRLLATVVALLGAFAAGCYRPGFELCGVRCAAGGGCPDGTSCAGDGYCHGATAELCAAQDAAPGDAMDHDAPPATGGPVARLITNAYFAHDGLASAGMSQTGFSVKTQGIVDGELVVLIASIDNGGSQVWPNPIASGFNQMTQQFYGSDGETFVAAWKVASHEPSAYVGTYGPGVNSGAAVITLIAVTGFNPAQPIDDFHGSFDTGPGMMPTVGTSVGVTTSFADDLLIYAEGADWLAANGTNTTQPPTGFTLLTSMGDHGDAGWDWTSQQVATKVQAQPGPTGTITGSLTGTYNGTAWTVVVAVAPKP